MKRTFYKRDLINPRTREGRELPPAERIELLFYCDMQIDTNEYHGTQEKIAKELGIPLRTVKYHIKKMIEKDIIIKLGHGLYMVNPSMSTQVRANVTKKQKSVYRHYKREKAAQDRPKSQTAI